MSTGGFDYAFVQGLVDFGRGMAGGFVGQPFIQYRLNPTSTGDWIAPTNIIDLDIRAKVTHSKKGAFIENDIIHANSFEFMLDSGAVRVGDILHQNDPVYGGNAFFAVASKRPLKATMCIRVNSMCRLYRSNSNIKSGYSGTTKASRQPFVLSNGTFVLDDPSVEATLVPCDLTYIGQIKNKKPSDLPMDSLTTWWYIYVPAVPGLDRLRENDIIVHKKFDDQSEDTYRVTGPYYSDAGTAGTYMLCERI